MIHRTILLAFTATWLLPIWLCAENGTSPEHGYLANGMKIGEVSHNSAIVWTRLTRHPEGNWKGYPFREVDDPKNADEGAPLPDQTGGRPLEDMEGSVPGAPGWVRVLYWPENLPQNRKETEWIAVDGSTDFCRQFPLDSLLPATRYVVQVEGAATKDQNTACSLMGDFHTAPAPDTLAPVQFVVVTCGDYPRRDDPEKGHKIYHSMLNLAPDFFVHTGDIEYYDKPLPYAVTRELARFKWNRFFALPYQRDFFLHVSSYFMKDDHDTLKNDCWPGQHYGNLTWEQGLATYREQVPMGEQPYRTARWGKDLQVWLVEGRDFRSPNTQRDGPGKSAWGAEQKAWFKKTVQASDAAFRILISPTPLVGPDRDSKHDNHANDTFAWEGRELRQFMAEQKNMIIINGDRHWQYVSVDDETGLYEFGTGPSSDSHAGGWDAGEVRPEHRYLRLKGGFLHVTVTREGDACKMILQHRGVDGEVYHEEVLTRTINP